MFIGEDSMARRLKVYSVARGCYCLKMRHVGDKFGAGDG